MKLLLFFLLTIFSTLVNAKNYYLSANGNDSNNGLTPTTAWKTIAKLNASFKNITYGDSILFNRGETYYGSIMIGKSGITKGRIVFGAFGLGSDPLITGFSDATGWIKIGTNIWQSAAITNASKPNIVTFNGTDHAMGRYPNSSYLHFESSIANSSITDKELSNSPNWTGGEVIIRKYHWYVSRDSITKHSGNTLNYKGKSPYNSTNGYGYFIQNSPSTLDTLNEWFFDNVSKKLMVYSLMAPTNVKVSSIDYLLNIGQNDYITVENISFSGANTAAITGGTPLNESVGVVIKNCLINDSGKDGIYFTRGQSCVVQNCTINNSHNNGISFSSTGGFSDNITIENNYVNKSGFFQGMGDLGGGFKGISVKGENALIQYNSVDSSGYNGIEFFYNNSKVNYNKVNYYCYNLDDGAGIYTWAGNSFNYTGREIKSNIVTNGIGAPRGTIDGESSSHGIYSDDGSSFINIDGNSVYGSSSSGIYIHNSHDINIRNNKVGDCKVAQLLMVQNGNNKLDIRNIALQSNEFVSTDSKSKLINISTIKNDIDSFGLKIGSIDNNNFCTLLKDNFIIHTTKIVNGTAVGNDYTLASWKTSFPNYDAGSKMSTVKFTNYKIDELLTGNLIPNGHFTGNIKGITSWSPTSNVTTSWDNTNKLSNGGSLTLKPGSTKTDFTILYSSAAEGIGSISSLKKYLLKVTTIGSSNNGILRGYLRKTNAPYTILSEIQNSDFNTILKTHEFLFSNPVTDGSATFVIEVQENNGITYLDNLSFFEVSASFLNSNDKIRFEYNAGLNVKAVELGSKYIEIDSTEYNGSIHLNPYKAAILIKSGGSSPVLSAFAGNDITLMLPTNSTLLSASSNADVKQFLWTKISGPDQFTILSPNAPIAQINNLSLGNYTFQLKVINNAGDSALSVVNVIVTGVLPVKLSEFLGKNINNMVALQWLSESELNVDYYAIQRSSDGKSFENIGKTLSKNNYDSRSIYYYDDLLPGKGINYYRLAMVDKDGTTNYSKTVLVSVSKVPSFTVFNTALSATNSYIKVGLNSNSQQSLQIALIDAAGRVLATIPIQVQKGFNEIYREIPGLNKGVYYIKMATKDQSITKALMSDN